MILGRGFGFFASDRDFAGAPAWRRERFRLWGRLGSGFTSLAFALLFDLRADTTRTQRNRADQD